MKTKIISLLVIIALAVVSCQKDEADKPAQLQDVTFGIELVDQLKYDGPWTCPNNLEAVKAEITITGYDDPFVVDLFWIEYQMYTQAIKLASGTYTITKFILLDASDQFVMAIPAENTVGNPSEYAEYVSVTVPFNFTVGAFTKIEIPVEVLCFLPSDYAKFGFFWFNITEIVIREFCFFGDICANDDPWVPTDFNGSLYTLVPGGVAVDMPAIFEIRVFEADGLTPVPDANNNVFSNLSYEMLGDPPVLTPVLDATKTVCARFPDRIRDLNEDGFVFELWVWVPDGTGFVFHKIAEFDVVETAGVWTIELDGANAIEQFNAVDFAIGTCSPFSTHEFPHPFAPIVP